MCSFWCFYIRTISFYIIYQHFSLFLLEPNTQCVVSVVTFTCPTVWELYKSKKIFQFNEKLFDPESNPGHLHTRSKTYQLSHLDRELIWLISSRKPDIQHFVLILLNILVQLLELNNDFKHFILLGWVIKRLVEG